jgi:hypothetical protein
MRVDRSKFLALTATLAASCAQRTPPPQEQPATVVATGAVVHVDAPPPAEPIFPDEVANQTQPTAQPDEELEGPWAAPQPAAEGYAPPQRPVSGAALACAQLRAPPGPHCESFHSLQAECESIVGALEPGAGQRAINCLLAKSGTRAICDFVATPKCAEQSLSGVPLRPATTRLCRSVARNCGRGITQGKCESFLSAVAPPNDAQLVTCLTESCSLTPCFFELL